MADTSLIMKTIIKKVRNEIIRKLYQIPLLSTNADIAYKTAIAKHINHLPLRTYFIEENYLYLQIDYQYFLTTLPENPNIRFIVNLHLLKKIY
ncbi:hypothetical protein [Nostoc sp. MS1]|uniref:hypothetical protein n=1 Tax=Nostoc sp. MS1 TaxID=2764711 RepID=UPI001CC7955D|nr:hypothetical protein [Nostoc sp. MS1]BCL35933.1 hypothetical protein NSMS1_23800 [Nostoc sp. MS1]